MTDRPTNVRWRVCILIAVASFVAYVLRTNMSVAGAPMSEDLGLSQVQLGVVLAALLVAVELRDRAVLELLYATGVRVSELCGLDVDGVEVTVLGPDLRQRLVHRGDPGPGRSVHRQLQVQEGQLVERLHRAAQRAQLRELGEEGQDRVRRPGPGRPLRGSPSRRA